MIAATILAVALRLTYGLHNMLPGHLTIYQDKGAGGLLNQPVYVEVKGTKFEKLGYLNVYTERMDSNNL